MALEDVSHRVGIKETWLAVGAVLGGLGPLKYLSEAALDLMVLPSGLVIEHKECRQGVSDDLVPFGE